MVCGFGDFLSWGFWVYGFGAYWGRVLGFSGVLEIRGSAVLGLGVKLLHGVALGSMCPTLWVHGPLG